MARTTFDVQNVGKPAPKWWRKLENGLLSILIPAIVLTLLGLGYDSNSKLILVINVLLVAIIKFVGYMLANGEVYANAGSLNPPVIINEVTTLPDTGVIGQWYHMGNNYYYWNGTSWVALYEDLGPGGGTNPPPTGLPPVKS